MDYDTDYTVVLIFPVLMFTISTHFDNVELFLLEKKTIIKC